EVSLGDEVTVDFEIADQNEIEIPEDLFAELTRRVDLLDAWERLTIGKRRGLAHRVSSAKRVETREQRILEVIDYVMDAAEQPELENRRTKT
ncbi:MAG: YdeI/OmpD-associated family protein, partial [Verrucomicrobiota bacterium]